MQAGGYQLDRLSQRRHTTTYDLTAAQGSVLMSLTSSGILGEQVYGPYGNSRYSQGSMATDKGYTGQFHDAVSGLDYYNARYYDPVIGQFLSADDVQGNAQGADPYAYVAGNPETMTDPTGNCLEPDTAGLQPSCTSGGGCPPGTHSSNGSCVKNGKPPKPTGPTAGDCKKQGLTLKGGVCVYVPPPCKGVWKDGKCVNTGKLHDPSVDYGSLMAGIGEMLAALGIIGAGIYAIITATETDLIWIMVRVLKNGFGAVAYLANDGLRHILGAFSQISPWAKVFADGVAILLDVVQIAINMIVLLANGGSTLENAEALKTLGDDINQVVGKILIENPGRLLAEITGNLVGGTLGLAGGVPTLIGDINSFGSDWNTAANS